MRMTSERSGTIRPSRPALIHNVHVYAFHSVLIKYICISSYITFFKILDIVHGSLSKCNIFNEKWEDYPTTIPTLQIEVRYIEMKFPLVLKPHFNLILSELFFWWPDRGQALVCAVGGCFVFKTKKVKSGGKNIPFLKYNKRMNRKYDQMKNGRTN